MIFKRCSACGDTKALTEFHRQGANKHRSQCIVCRSVLRNAEGKDGKGLVGNLLAGARKRGRLKGIECTITHEDIVVPEFCPVFGVRLEVADGIATNNSPTLDRIDNAKGYVPGNVMVVSWRANRLKADATFDELERVSEFYGAYRPSRWRPFVCEISIT